MDVAKIIHCFMLEGTFVTSTPFGRGHINDTFRIKTDVNEYLLQRINHQVFKNVEQLMHNMLCITQHIEQQIHAKDYETLKLIPTQQNQYFHKDELGNYWRVYIFKDHLHAYEFPKNLNQVYESAKAFGRFLWYLQDFPVDQLFYSIPNFHNVAYRIKQFKQALDFDLMGRRSQLANWVDYIFFLADEMMVIEKLGQQQKIPLRVTHNDCKFNNALLDEQDKGRCIIDLDTVMPGYIHYDFGDGIRTTASTASEDEPDLSLVELDRARFASFTAGYLDATRDLLTPLEIKFLGMSGALLAYLMGVRFMTDYLNGDQYYKIDFEHHNYQRSCAQLTLTQNILAQLPDLNNVVRRLS